jgi:GLPGLI family protein
MKLFDCLIIGLISIPIFSQTIKVEYKSEKKISEERLLEMREHYRKPILKNYYYTLVLSNNIASYKTNKNVIDNTVYNDDEKEFIKGQDINLYKNFVKDINSNIFYGNFNLREDAYSIKDSLIDREWKITNETKIISDYKCLKAISNKNSFELTAWFTEDLDAKTGPDYYDGLPGLILEIDTKYMNILAVDVKVEPETTIIDLPVFDGKTYTFKSLDEKLNEPKTSTFTIGNTTTTTTTIRKKLD